MSWMLIGVIRRTCLADRRSFQYAHHVSAGERWTDEAVCLESESWIHVPSDGVRLEDERRLLVHLPTGWTSPNARRSGYFPGMSGGLLAGPALEFSEFPRKREVRRWLVSAPLRYEYLRTSIGRVRPSSPASACAREG